MSFAFCNVSFAVVLMLLALMELFVLGESAVVEADMLPVFGESPQDLWLLIGLQIRIGVKLVEVL